MYQTPRMMVPVRTWQHRQQLVEYQRFHGEIIILRALSQLREHSQTTSVFVKERGPAVLSGSALESVLAKEWRPGSDLPVITVSGLTDLSGQRQARIKDNITSGFKILIVLPFFMLKYNNVLREMFWAKSPYSLSYINVIYKLEDLIFNLITEHYLCYLKHIVPH